MEKQIHIPWIVAIFSSNYRSYTTLHLLICFLDYFQTIQKHKYAFFVKLF